jgi:ubiquinone/menaquinone biosynthesis C-methylase UbiE
MTGDTTGFWSDSKIIIDYYSSFDEASRLNSNIGPLEFCRSKEIIGRFLPTSPATVHDVGGGTGIYSCWLGQKGYHVNLVDMVPLHVDQARKNISHLGLQKYVDCAVGNALELDFEGRSAEAVLLMGPLYHLTSREDRMIALGEARRVLKRGGLLFATAVSRFASFLDGLDRGFVHDPKFLDIIREDLRSGQHRNPTGNTDYWTTAYLHEPEEFASELNAAGFVVEHLLAIEGPLYLLRDFPRVWVREERRAPILELLRQIEAERTLLGASPHIMGVARRIE